MPTKAKINIVKIRTRVRLLSGPTDLNIIFISLFKAGQNFDNLKILSCRAKKTKKRTAPENRKLDAAFFP